MSLCRIVRKIKAELADRKQIFNGHFEENCKEQSVSPTFLSLMNMLTGFEITDDVESSKLSPALVLAQLLAFNSAKNRKSTGAFRHNADQETPVAIYIAFLIHSKTRSEDLVNRLHSLGLYISYDRLSTLSTYLGNSVIDQCDKDGLVCPTVARWDAIFLPHKLLTISTTIQALEPRKTRGMALPYLPLSISKTKMMELFGSLLICRKTNFNLSY